MLAITEINILKARPSQARRSMTSRQRAQASWCARVRTDLDDHLGWWMRP